MHKFIKIQIAAIFLILFASCVTNEGRDGYYGRGYENGYDRERGGERGGEHGERGGEHGGERGGERGGGEHR